MTKHSTRYGQFLLGTQKIISKQYRHKLFYILAFVIILVIYLLFFSSSFVFGWIKYCNSATLKLSYFNSIFELCVTFSLAYSVIAKFRNEIKLRVFNSVQRQLEKAKTSAQIILLSTPANNVHLSQLTEYIVDIQDRIILEKDRKEKNHRSEGPFLYFSFYSLICLITGGLIDGYSQSDDFVFEGFSFIFLFGILSAIFLDIRYIFSVSSQFEGTLLIFLIITLVCFYLAHLATPSLVFNAINSYPSLSSKYFLTTPIKVQAVYNYCILIALGINIYPYFMFFRKIYFISSQYSCTSWQITLAVRLKFAVTRIFHFIGTLFESAGEQIAKFGRKVKNGE